MANEVMKMAIYQAMRRLSKLKGELEEKRDRDYRAEYDNYHKKPEQRRNNDKRKQARRNMTYAGKVHKGDGKDVDHKNPLRSGGSNDDSNLKVRDRSSNRSDNGQGK